MAPISNVCVYCGSHKGDNPEWRRAAQRLGRGLVERGIGLVYGGGTIGLMGEIADSMIAAGGRVTGIIPSHLDKHEIGHRGVSELLIVESMHERKRLMFDKSDAFVVLPGGIGTLDETFEIVTWRQLHLHDKPVLLVNQEGYWEPFLALIDHIIARDFASVGIKRLFDVVDDVDQVFDALDAASAPREQARAHRL
jgi:uncharacterized protein (TIGR00730 family)